MSHHLSPRSLRASLSFLGLLLLLVACGRGGPSGEYLTTYFEVPAGTAALDATLSYDPAALEYLGAASTQEQVMVEANAHAERVKLASITLSPEGKRLAFVTFKVKQGGSEPSLQSASAYTSAGTPLGRVTVRSERSEQDLAANYRTPASLTSQAVSAQDLDLQASFAERLLGDVIPDNDSNPSNDLNSVDALGVLQLAAGALSAPSDLQLYLADLDTSGTVNSIDAQISLLKAADGDLDATLRATPDALQLEVGETGLILAGNAGNAPLTLALPQVDGVTITQVGGIANQTAAYEVTPGSEAKSGLIVLDAGSAGRRSVGLLVSGEPMPTFEPIRINAGGKQYTDTSGNIWSADQHFNGGQNWPSTPKNEPIANTENDELYQTERSASKDLGTFSYDIPVGSGSYTVKLHFAEIYFGATNSPSGPGGAGKRVFSVDIEGQSDLSGYDINADVGPSTAVVKTFPNVSVTDGALSLDFSASVNRPKISAIEILSAEPTPGKLSASSSSLDFGSVVTGSSKTQSVTLTNLGESGDTSIAISSVSVGGAFSTDFASTTLAPGASTSFDVTFAPTSTGNQSAQLKVVHDAPNTASPITITLSGEGASDSVPTEPSFNSSGLAGESSSNPTSLQFGPDGRLYVAQQNGTIYAYTVERDGANDYKVVDTEAINHIKNIPNHNDDGTNSGVNNRQVTGIYVTGTASNPVLYVSSSDPRIGAGSGGGDKGLDTNSGVVSRLTWTGSSWSHVDLVRGLPRSEENHASNGLQLDEVNNILYLAQGGHTNAGAPSNNFAFSTEYALAAAILSIDLNAIGNTTYDLPTLDDPTRDNLADGSDPGDPFGGNDGLNQAKLVPGGPVQIYSPGYRNAYDLVITQAGRMYTVDNGANGGWGGHPAGEADVPNETTIGSCTNEYLSGEPGSKGTGPGGDSKVNNKDNLHLVTADFYAGHPTPVRGNPTGAGLYLDNPYFKGWLEPGDDRLPADWPPVPAGYANAAECDFRNPGETDGALATFGASTNGITEYTASNFGGALQGSLLTASFDGKIYQADLNSAGDSADMSTFASGFGSQPLDVTALGDDGPFPGTVWAATYGANNITVFEPADYGTTSGGGSGGGGTLDPNCQTTAANNLSGDEDNDGYSNGDEIDNETNPCSGASKPADYDNDKVSDANDADDDNDGIEDVNDAFALDADNGTETSLPYTNELFNDQSMGFFSTGLTGLMTNGTTDYLGQFDPVELVAGGTSGLLTVQSVTEGDSWQGNNTQDNAFQLGVDVSEATGPFTAMVQINGDFFDNDAPKNYQSQGMFIGTGDQDNYLKVVLRGNNGTNGFQVAFEDGGNNKVDTKTTVDGVLDADNIQLYISVDPVAGTAQPKYALNGGAVTNLGTPITLSGDLLDAVKGTYTVNGKASALAVGIISTSTNSGDPFIATWDKIIVTKDAPQVAANPQALVEVTPNSNKLDASTYGSNSFKITNIGDTKITSVTFDTTSALFPDLAFDPVGGAGDKTAKCLTKNDDDGVGLLTDAPGGSSSGCTDGFSGAFGGGYAVLTLDFGDFEPGETLGFSVDMDPTSTKGSSSPGANHAGSVSGLELSGSSVTITFANGSTLSGSLFGDGTLAGANATIKADAPAKPTLNTSFTPNATTSVASQTVTVSGVPAGATVKLLQVEGGLFEQTSPAVSLFDVDAFEANSAVKVTYLSKSAFGGSATFNVTLSESSDDLNPNNGTPYSTQDIGLNHFIAAIQDADGDVSVTSDVKVVRYDPATASSPTVLYRVNNGGAAIADAELEWSADQSVSNTGGAASKGTPSPYLDLSTGFDKTYGPNSFTIDNSTGAPDTLFATERYSDAANPNNMHWDFPVSNGTYEVRLYFAENWSGAAKAGVRVFDVEVEGALELDDYDVYVAAGNSINKAVVETFNVTVSDGNLDIDFIKGAQNPAVKGIEIVKP